MPWSQQYFPAAMAGLVPMVREKAVEIANALLAEGMDEGRAIRIAIARAKEWAVRRGLPLRLNDWPSRRKCMSADRASS